MGRSLTIDLRFNVRRGLADFDTFLRQVQRRASASPIKLGVVSTENGVTTWRPARSSGGGSASQIAAALGLDVGGGRSFGAAAALGLGGLASGFYVASRAASAFKRVALDTFGSLASGIASATENQRRFVASLSNVAGGLDRARAINRALVRDSQQMVQTIGELRQSATTFAATPFLSSRLAFGSPESAARSVERYSSLTRRLGVLDPIYGAEGAEAALRQTFQGDTVSLRRRLGIDQKTIARLLKDELAKERGVTSLSLRDVVGELKFDPGLQLRGLEKFADLFLPNENAFKNLISTRLSKIKDQFQQSLADIGEGGVFDSAVSKLEGLQKAFGEHLLSPQWQSQAKRLSASLNGILDDLGGGIGRFLQHLVGAKDAPSTVAGTVELGVKAVERLREVTRGLPDLGSSLGDGLRSVGEAVEKAASELGILSDQLGGGVGGMAESYFAEKYQRLDPEARDYARIAELTKQLDRMGIHGARAGYVKTGERAWVPDWLNEFTYWRDIAGASLDTSEVKDPRQRILAERLMEAWKDVPITDTRRSQMLTRLAREAIPDLDDRLKSKGPTTRQSSPNPDEDYAGINELLRSGYHGPNFFTQLQSTGTILGQLSDLAHRDTTFADVVGRSRAAFSANLGTKDEPLLMTHAFVRMKRAYDSSASVLDGAIDAGTERLGVEYSQSMAENVKRLKAIRAAVGTGYDEAVLSLRDQATSFAQDFGKVLSDNLSDLPPDAQAMFLDRIGQGTTSLANRVVEWLDEAAGQLDRPGLRVVNRAKTIGIGSLTPEEQQRHLTALIGANRNAIDATALYGRGTVGMSSSDLALAFAQRPGDREVARDRLAYLGGALSDQGEMVDRLRGAVANGATDEGTLRALSLATGQYRELLKMQDEARRSVDDLRQAYEAFATGARDSLEHGLGDALYGLVTGTEKLSDAFRSLAASLLHTWSDVTAKLALKVSSGTSACRSRAVVSVGWAG